LIYDRQSKDLFKISKENQKDVTIIHLEILKYIRGVLEEGFSKIELGV
jgi:hypothetical protein